METKKCTKCQQIKELTEYSINGKFRRTACKMCLNKIQRNKYKKNFDKINQKNKIWAKNNKDKVREIQIRWYNKNAQTKLNKCKAWAKANPEKVKNSHLKRTYNIEITTYYELYKKQNGVCAICQCPETAKHKNGKTKRLAVDHCHKTGKVRGLLCVRCNMGIGVFKDSTNLLILAIKYIKGLI